MDISRNDHHTDVTAPVPVAGATAQVSVATATAQVAASAATAQVAASAATAQVPGATAAPVLAAPGALSPAGHTVDRLGWAVRLARSVLRRAKAGPCLFVGDLVALLVAGAGTGVEPRTGAVTLVLVLLSYQAGRLYRPRLSLSLLDDLPALGGRILAVTAAVLAGSQLLPVDWDDPGLLRAASLAVALLLVARGVEYSMIRAARARRLVAHRTLVVGDDPVARSLAARMLDHPEYGLNPIGCLCARRPRTRLPVPLLGGPEDLARVVRDLRITVVVLAFGTSPTREMVACLRTCDRLRCEIFWVPRLFELSPVHPQMDMLWGYPLIRRHRDVFGPVGRALKRAFDVVFAALALVVALPVMAVCALAVRLEGGTGVLFRQERLGMNLRPFTLLKFRSLRPSSTEEQQSRWSIAEDHRLGPVGRALRRSSLDELPQLWNVLVGDMSVVGPRPERPLFVNRFIDTYPRYADRHRVRAGLTGWSQIHGLRGNTSIADRARFDNQYIENWSLWGDVKIILRTIVALFRHRGA
ncbi:MAG TPA: sugar transferase [Micromonosporaceae bacterium]